MSSFTHGLNQCQLEAVTHFQGPLLIVAGAGSGKTRVLTNRIAYLIQNHKVKPGEIFAVTFTNKAAREMQERVIKTLGGRTGELWVTTFHSAGVKILRNDIERLGYRKDFVIYDQQDHLSLIKQIIRALNINEKAFTPQFFSGHIQAAKTEGILPPHFKGGERDPINELVRKVYSHYQQELLRNNAVDFSDLLLLTTKLFEEFPQVLDHYQKKFSFIMVDEYQDTNHVQYRMLHALARKHKNICVVGDEDQSIYSWRGADITNILSFERDFPGAKIIKLEQNYRSTKTIIEAASILIASNSQRKPKKLWTENPDGELISLNIFNDEYEEARFVTEEIRATGCSYRDCSVFYRTHAQSRVFEDELRRRGIPYRIYGGLRFYDRAEIKNILAYLKFLLNPNDSVSLLRIINVPARGIGKTSIEKLIGYAQANATSIWGALDRCEDISPATAKKTKGFINLIRRLKSEMDQMRLDELYLKLIDETGYVRILKSDGTIESLSRIENLEEFFEVIREFIKNSSNPTPSNFLEEVSLVTDLDSFDPSTPCVNLMTLHSAKGLEFPVVFMVGLEEGLFPHQSAQYDSDEIEEERRLCYVGMTRAKEKLYLSYAKFRQVYGARQYNPHSRFIDEIPDSFMAKNDNSISLKPSITLLRPPSTDDIFSDALDINSATGLKIGQRVRHPAFGIGVVKRLEGEEEHEKVTISFPSYGQKRFLSRFVNLEKIT